MNIKKEDPIFTVYKAVNGFLQLVYMYQVRLTVEQLCQYVYCCSVLSCSHINTQ